MTDWKKIVSSAEKKLARDAGMSLSQYARDENLDYLTLYGMFKKHAKRPELVSCKRNGKTRNHKTAHDKMRKLKIEDLEQVVELYFDKKMSLASIATKYNTTAATVMSFLKRNGHRTRTTSEASRIVMSRPEMREKMRAYAMEGRIGIYAHDRRYKDTTPELLFKSWCDRSDIEYVQQFKIDGYYHAYDFYLPSLNTIVEIDGVYWHNLPGRREKDVQQTETAIDRGFNMVRITDKEASYDVFERLLDVHRCGTSRREGAS